jgi:hypothetical protein
MQSVTADNLLNVVEQSVIFSFPFVDKMNNQMFHTDSIYFVQFFLLVFKLPLRDTSFSKTGLFIYFIW